MYRLFKGGKTQSPTRKNSSVWVKKSNPATCVVILENDGKRISYYYTKVNGNHANTGKTYTETVSSFYSKYRKE